MESERLFMAVSADICYWVDLKKAALHIDYADIVWLLKRIKKPGLVNILTTSLLLLNIVFRKTF